MEGLVSFLEQEFVFGCLNNTVILKSLDFWNLFPYCWQVVASLLKGGSPGRWQRSGEIFFSCEPSQGTLEREGWRGGCPQVGPCQPASPFYKITELPSYSVRFYQIFSYFLFLFKQHINSRDAIFSCLNPFLTNLLNAFQFLNQLPYPECLPNPFH